MDKFVTRFGNEVDLDELYDEAVKSGEVIPDRLACIKELGYALVYMDYLHAEINWADQRKRVVGLCWELVKLGDQQYAKWAGEQVQELRDELREEGRRLYFKFHFRILDETENMC